MAQTNPNAMITLFYWRAKELKVKITYYYLVLFTKRTTLCLALILAFLTSLITSVTIIKASSPTWPSTPDTSLPIIKIDLPEDNKTYNTRDIPYSITVEKPSSWINHEPINGQLFDVYYYLDNGTKVILADLCGEYYNKQPSTFKGTLTSLLDGDHSFEIYVNGVSYYQDSHQMQGIPSNYYMNNNCTVYFTIDTTPPIVSILSLQNIAYNTTEIPLIFEVNETTSKISYCLDKASNITITGNSTLTELSVGAHNVTVYAWDPAGNIGASQTINFTVTKQEKQPQPPEPFATAIILVIILIVISSMSLLFYFGRQKH